MIWSESPRIDVINGDCMEGMKQFKDKYFELAIVDVPYGINASNYERGGTQYGASMAKCNTYIKKDWDKIAPDSIYFDLLKIKSTNQVIWGANHFIDNLPFNVSSPCWLVWDKVNGDNGYADCELAWTSFTSAIRKLKYTWHGMIQQNMKNKEERIHPTQKPVALYKWLLKNYAKPGDKILDTHLGSGSIAIACYDMGFDLTGFEIDKDYYEAAHKRFKNHISQLKLF